MWHLLSLFPLLLNNKHDNIGVFFRSILMNAVVYLKNFAYVQQPLDTQSLWASKCVSDMLKFFWKLKLINANYYLLITLQTSGLNKALCCITPPPDLIMVIFLINKWSEAHPLHISLFVFSLTLFSFDGAMQTLNTAARRQSDDLLEIFVEMRGHLYLLAATLLLKMAHERQQTWRAVTDLSAMCYLLAYQVPVHLLRINSAHK